MAERKSGPVKPPVIDLKARAAQGRPGAGKASERTPARRDGGAASSARATASPAPASPQTPTEQSVSKAEMPDTRPSGTPDATAAPARQPAPAAAGTEPPRQSEPPRAAGAAAASRPAAALPPRPPARLAMPWSAISIAAIVGALLGTLLTYAVVNVLPLPEGGPAFVDPAPRLDAEEKAIDDLTARLTDLEDRERKTQVSLDATIAQLDSGLAEIRQSVAAIPAPQPVDLAPVEAEIKTLEDRIGAIGAGASSADAEALASTIARLQSDLAVLKTSVDQLGQRASGTDQRLSALGGELDAAKNAIAVQNQTLGGAEISPAVRLPLVVSGLENAFANGRPYATELKSLTTLLPDLLVPAPIASNAATGLPRPDLVAQRFSAAMPAILGGRTATGSGDWTQDAIEWVKAMLALRPAGETEGNSPDAVVSRLEAAVDRRDFPAAADLLAELPASMREAAGEVATDVADLASAEAFLTGLRAQALAPADAASAAGNAGTAQ